MELCVNQMFPGGLFYFIFWKKNKRKRKLVFFSEKEKVFHQKEISPCYLYFVFDSFPLSFILPISFDLCVGIYCSLYWTFYFSDAILKMKIYIIWIIFKRIFQLLVGWLFVFVFWFLFFVMNFSIETVKKPIDIGILFDFLISPYLCWSRH